MNLRRHFLPERKALLVCQETRFQRALVMMLVVLTALGGLSSCHRASPAFFAKTPHPVYQRVGLSSPAIQPVSDSLVSASLTDGPAVSTVPVWQKAVGVPEGVTQAALVTPVRRPTILSPVKRLLPRKPAPPQCDQIVLRNGDVVEAKVKEVGVSEIRYKKCDRPDGPDYTITKRDVLSIKYSNGEVERFAPGANSSSPNSAYNSPTSSSTDGPRTDPFAIVAISAGGLAIFTGLGSLLLGAAAVVFGALSLARIRKEPNRFKGKGLAMAGMIIGIVAAAAVLLYVYVI